MELLKLVINIVIALGTVVALLALIYQLHKDSEGKKYEQANKVSCWIDLSNKHEARANNCYKELVRISNRSGQPIYDVIVAIDTENTIASYLAVVAEYNSEFIAYIPDGEYSTTVDWTCNDYYNQYNAAIFFRDVQGNYWIRNGKGILLSVTRKDAEKILSVPKLPMELQRIMEYRS